MTSMLYSVSLFPSRLKENLLAKHCCHKLVKQIQNISQIVVYLAAVICTCIKFIDMKLTVKHKENSKG